MRVSLNFARLSCSRMSCLRRPRRSHTVLTDVRSSNHRSHGNCLESRLRPGIGIDGDDDESPIILFKEVGKVAALRQLVAEGHATTLAGLNGLNGTNGTNGSNPLAKVDMTKVFYNQTSMAHTRWATHGSPSPLNCHPHVSDARGEFSVVHSEPA